jgi:type II secretory pathway component PulK
MIVLWAIAIMSVAILGLVQFMELDLSESASQSKNFKALQLAESGLALGLHPKLEKDDSHLHQDLGSGESFTVVMKSEGARININVLLLNNRRTELVDLFQSWKVKDEELYRLVDHLMDWVDEDSLRRLNGAEQEDYEKLGFPGYPPNRPFQSLEEMELVPGMEFLMEAKPDWKDFFTVWGDGKLDLNEAPAEAIAAVCRVGTVPAEMFVKRRLGPDKEAGTVDDFEYKDMTQVRSALGLSESLFKTVESRITLKSEYRRIVSVGKIGSYERSLAVVVHLNSNPIQYLTWIEY